MKYNMIFLVLALLLTSCQPAMTPTPIIQEVTRIVEQTVKVTQIVEQTVEIPIIVKETVIIKKLVPAQTMTPRSPEITSTPTSILGDYTMDPNYYDAMVALVQTLTYLKTKQCEWYYDSLREKTKEELGKDRIIRFCEQDHPYIFTLVVPYNYYRELRGMIPQREPDGCLNFTVKYDLIFERENDDPFIIKSTYRAPMCLEDGAWKYGGGYNEN